MNYKHVISTFFICAGLGLFSTQASAQETAPGDYEQLPGGLNVGILYYQTATREKLRSNGETLTDNFKLNTDIAIARYIGSRTINKTTTYDLNAILPLGEVSTSGDAAVLGDANGVGDLTLGVAFKKMTNVEKRNITSFGIYAGLPTGSYENTRALNLGANRYSLNLQVANVSNFNNGWSLETIGDVTLFGKNDEFGPANSTLKQDPRFELIGHLRKKVTKQTELAFSLGHVFGGEEEVDGVDRDNKLQTTYGRLTASHFLKPTLQLQVQIGADLSVEEGPKEKGRLNLRVVKIF